MLKVFKYLKSSIFSVLAVILLLFVQAYLDLTLPDYTSKIVNVGVQQGGIENAAIETIGEDTLNKLVLFMDKSDKKYILNHYEKTDTYQGENIYELKENSDTEKVSSIMAKPMLIVSFAEQSDESKEGSVSFDLPEGVSLYQALNMMSDTERGKMLKDIDKKLKDIPDTIIDQAAVSYVKTEYQRIGIDTDQIQTMYIFKVGLIMLGIALAAMLGSKARDEIAPDGFMSNHSGGILGGISSGQEIKVRIALKPTSSIMVPGKSIDRQGNSIDLVTKGRHDPCVGIRAVPIAEAMLALCLIDAALLQRAQCGHITDTAYLVPRN